MSAYARLAMSLLVEMSNRKASRRGRGPSKNAQKRARKAAAAAAAATATASAATSKDVEARNASPLDPAPSPVDPSPEAQAAIDAVKQDQKPETTPEPDKEDKTPEKQDKPSEPEIETPETPTAPKAPEKEKTPAQKSAEQRRKLVQSVRTRKRLTGYGKKVRSASNKLAARADKFAKPSGPLI